MLTWSVAGSRSSNWSAAKMAGSSEFGGKVELESRGKGGSAGTENPTIDGDGVTHP